MSVTADVVALAWRALLVSVVVDRGDKLLMGLLMLKVGREAVILFLTVFIF